MTWQPISTAPKDCTIELWGPYASEPATARWCERKKEWRAVWDGSDVVEYMSDFGTQYKTFDAPTHWKHLSEPPPK